MQPDLQAVPAGRLHRGRQAADVLLAGPVEPVLVADEVVAGGAPAVLLLGRDHLSQRVARGAAGAGVGDVRAAFAPATPGVGRAGPQRQPDRRLARRGDQAAAAERVDVVGERDGEPLAACERRPADDARGGEHRGELLHQRRDRRRRERLRRGGSAVHVACRSGLGRQGERRERVVEHGPPQRRPGRLRLAGRAELSVTSAGSSARASRRPSGSSSVAL